VGAEELADLAECGGALAGPECLLFLDAVERLAVSVWRPGEDAMAPVFSTALQTPVPAAVP
jgi:hypothetical protein